MAQWSKNNEAHRSTWAVEMAITGLKKGFADSAELTIEELTRKVPGASGAMDSISIDAHLHAFLLMIKAVGPQLEKGQDYNSVPKKIRKVMADGTKTLNELADVVDDVLLFIDEIEG